MGSALTHCVLFFSPRSLSGASALPTLPLGRCPRGTWGLSLPCGVGDLMMRLRRYLGLSVRGLVPFCLVAVGLVGGLTCKARTSLIHQRANVSSVGLSKLSSYSSLSVTAVSSSGRLRCGSLPCVWSFCVNRLGCARGPPLLSIAFARSNL